MKYTINLSDRQDKRLEELASELQVSKAHVVREALALFTVVVRETADGSKVLKIENPNDDSEPAQVLITLHTGGG